MSETTRERKTHKADDNCENCIKERKENESFIGIYTRLQSVAQKTQRVRAAVDAHKVSSDTNRSFCQQLAQKVVSLPKVKRQVNSKVLESVGFELAASILEHDQHKRVVEQNQRLKQIISDMRRQKWDQHSNHEAMQRSCFVEKTTQLAPLDRTYNSESPKVSGTLALQNLLLSNEPSENEQSRSTLSTNFGGPHPDQLRKSLDLRHYEDLNLWLYQNERNAKLQAELFLPTKAKGKAVQRESGRVPAARRPKK